MNQTKILKCGFAFVEVAKAFDTESHATVVIVIPAATPQYEGQIFVPAQSVQFDANYDELTELITALSIVRDRLMH